MSKYTYAGDFVNPTDTWRVAQKFDDKGEYLYSYIEVLRKKERTDEDGKVWKTEYWEAHTSGRAFPSDEEAYEYIEDIEQSFEEDYDDYLEENHDAIVQMERYEMWRNEY